MAQPLTEARKGATTLLHLPEIRAATSRDTFRAFGKFLVTQRLGNTQNGLYVVDIFLVYSDHSASVELYMDCGMYRLLFFSLISLL
jgi:hypothetical protein